MALNFLLDQVRGAITQHAGQQQQTGFDPSGLLSQVEGLFGQHAASTGQQHPARLAGPLRRPRPEHPARLAGPLR